MLEALKAIKIPNALIGWIESCITTPQFSISLNGQPYGYFRATSCLRQRDPFSPYLFMIAMEGLIGILHKAIPVSPFKYHWKCKKNCFTHLSFADDLMLFCHGDIDLIRVIKNSLEMFNNQSGLSVNLAKSQIFTAGMDRDVKQVIMGQLGFQAQSLRVTYLGVPLITSRLTNLNCMPLVERITSRIKLWTSATLSYTGRIQLIRSVLFSMQVYWATKLILPKATIKAIKKS